MIKPLPFNIVFTILFICSLIFAPLVFADNIVHLKIGNEEFVKNLPTNLNDAIKDIREMEQMFNDLNNNYLSLEKQFTEQKTKADQFVLKTSVALDSISLLLNRIDSLDQSIEKLDLVSKSWQDSLNRATNKYIKLTNRSFNYGVGLGYINVKEKDPVFLLLPWASYRRVYFGPILGFIGGGDGTEIGVTIGYSLY